MVPLALVLDALRRPGPRAWSPGAVGGAVAGLGAGLRGGAHQRLLVWQSAVRRPAADPLAPTAGGQRLRERLRQRRLPAHDPTLVAGSARRCLPLLAEEAERIRMGQGARRVDWTGCGVVSRARAQRWSLLAPLLVRAIRRADGVAVAVAARGGVAARRSGWRATRPGGADAMAATVVAALLAWATWSMVWRP